MELKPLKDIQDGDLIQLGAVEFFLDAEGLLVRRRAIVEHAPHKIGDLMEKKIQLRAQLKQVETLIDKYNELSKEAT